LSTCSSFPNSAARRITLPLCCSIKSEKGGRIDGSNDRQNAGQPL
jgi:hypothetical protein